MKPLARRSAVTASGSWAVPSVGGGASGGGGGLSGIAAVLLVVLVGVLSRRVERAGGVEDTGDLGALALVGFDVLEGRGDRAGVLVLVAVAAPPALRVAPLEDGHRGLPAQRTGRGLAQQLGLCVGGGAFDGVTKVQVDPLVGADVLVEVAVLLGLLERLGFDVVAALEPAVEGAFADAYGLGGGGEVVALEHELDDLLGQLGGELAGAAGDLVAVVPAAGLAWLGELGAAFAICLDEGAVAAGLEVGAAGVVAHAVLRGSGGALGGWGEGWGGGGGWAGGVAV